MPGLMRRPLALALLLASAGVAAQSVKTDHFMPASSAVTEQRFSCHDAAGGTVDAAIGYGSRRDGKGHVGRVDTLRLGGKDVSAAVLAETNSRLAGRVVEGVSASCQKDGAIRLIAKVWTPGGTEAKSEWLTIVRNAQGGVEFF